MKRSESKYFNTAARMDEAFLTLLEKKDFAYITVKEICETAGVNRSTFYLHYETMGDLLSESTEYLYRQLIGSIQVSSQSFEMKLENCPMEDLYLVTPEYLAPYLTHIKAHKRLFRTALENAAVLGMENIYQKMFRQVFTPILIRYQVPEQDRHYLMTFYLCGLMAVITEWLKDDCCDSVDHVMEVIQQCVGQHRTEKR